MRVTNSMIREGALQGLNTNATSLAQIQEQLSSSKLLNRPSDDPAQVSQAMKVRDSLSELEQFTRNINAADQTVSASDTAMASAGELIQRASELAIQGANATYSASDRQAMAVEVEQLARQLVQLAGTKVGDTYIFSGFKSATPPYSEAAPGSAAVSAYGGDTGKVVARIAPGTTAQVNVTADVVFKPALDALNLLQGELSAGTPVSSATITAISTGHDALLSGRATVGALQNRLDGTAAFITQATTAAQQLLSQTEDIDMAAVITQYSARQLTYNAALKVNAQIMQTSLLDYLK